jgi:energy-coupling factor transporter ATP-binding protein EcfA2
MRTIPQTLPTIDSMGLPQVLKDVAVTKRGLVIFVGATGSGKSTSLAAMVDYRNENSYGHIITIEDPVEFVHPHKNCIITQREVGIDTDGWEQALKNTLRPGAGRDPDGRNPRPRDDGARGGVRRDRPPVPGTLHANSATRRWTASSLLPRGASRAAADGPVAEPEGAGLAAPAAAPGRHAAASPRSRSC